MKFRQYFKRFRRNKTTTVKMADYYDKMETSDDSDKISCYSTVCDCMEGHRDRQEFRREMMKKLISETSETEKMWREGLLEFCSIMSEFLLMKGKMGSRMLLKDCMDYYSGMGASYHIMKAKKGFSLKYYICVITETFYAQQ